MRRRRPLLRAAAVAGTFAAGRAMGRRADQQASAQGAQEQRISTAENQQAQQAAVPAQGGPASAEASMMEQLSRLSTLHQQGALTDEEFAAAKAKVLGG